MKATLYAAAVALASTTQAAQFVMYTPGGDSDLVERQDAIVSPGRISGHAHQIFGASNASPDMTYESLQKSDCTTVGSASGQGNAADKSVYWHPSMFAEAKDGSGYLRIPTGGHKLYYRDVGNAADKKADPFEFPKGFHMVAGDMTRRAANPDTQKQFITEWICHTKSSMILGVDNKSGFPKDVSNCDSYPGFAGSIHFPHCWNGEEASVDDNSHMAYPDGDVQAGPCPSSHPIRLPHIFMENFFDLAKVADQIKPNTFVLSQGDSTGYGWHADFFNGWSEGAIPKLMDSCPQPEWGNADIGTCPSFEACTTKNGDCKLSPTYKENIDSPGQHLPGCNPITTVNPAPKMAAAALGVCTDQCAKAGSAPPSYSNKGGDSGSAPKAPSYAPAPPKAAITPAAPPPAAIPAAKDAVDYEIVWVTKTITITDYNPVAAAAAPTPVSYKKRHEHIHKHRMHRA